jgi:hypothetical protein
MLCAAIARNRLIRHTIRGMLEKVQRAAYVADAGKPGACDQNFGTLRCILKRRSHIQRQWKGVSNI